jgi:hypothetical protein
MAKHRTDKEVMELMMGKSPFNEARQAFSFAAAALEQADAQRTPLSPIERRRMEFEAVERIVAALGIRLDLG